MIGPAKKGIYYGWVIVVSCLVINLSSFGIRYSYGVFLKSLEMDFGWSRSLTSGVFSTYMLLCSIFAFCGGWALDRYGPRMVVITMGIFSSASLLLSSQADSLWKLFLSYSLLLAIGTGPTYAVVMATVSRWFSKKRATAVAIVGAGIGLGILVMNPVAAFLVSGYGWKSAFRVVGIIALLTILPSAALLRKAPATDNGSAAGEGTPGKREQPADGFSLLQAVKGRNFWLIFSIWFLYSFCSHLVLTHLIPYADELGIPITKASFLLILFGGSSIVGRVAMGGLSDRFGRKSLIVASALFMAAAILQLSLSSGWPMLQAFALVFGFFYGGIDPPITALLGEVFGLRHIGMIMGVLVSSWSIGGAAGPGVGGYLFDITGNYFLAFLTGMCSMLLLPVFFLFVRTGKRPLATLSS